MITAKLSDVWGLKTLLLSCAVIFLIFSMACGAAQTMLQLIVFRALQGIGGSGLYSLTFVSIMKMLEPEKIGFYSGVISSVFAVANLLGPLVSTVACMLSFMADTPFLSSEVSSLIGPHGAGSSLSSRLPPSNMYSASS